ncbi:hypothetical protein H4S14_001363 [Agrobacterium vitis]|nr:hypothetical protein [Agrobacterium vitis]MBE1437625.1 hypothetical protein [Agrobacterium vitis]
MARDIVALYSTFCSSYIHHPHSYSSKKSKNQRHIGVQYRQIRLKPGMKLSQRSRRLAGFLANTTINRMTTNHLRQADKSYFIYHFQMDECLSGIIFQASLMAKSAPNPVFCANAFDKI